MQRIVIESAEAEYRPVIISAPAEPLAAISLSGLRARISRERLAIMGNWIVEATAECELPAYKWGSAVSAILV